MSSQCPSGQVSGGEVPDWFGCVESVQRPFNFTRFQVVSSALCHRGTICNWRGEGVW